MIFYSNSTFYILILFLESLSGNIALPGFFLFDGILRLKNTTLLYISNFSYYKFIDSKHRNDN